MVVSKTELTGIDLLLDTTFGHSLASQSQGGMSCCLMIRGHLEHGHRSILDSFDHGLELLEGMAQIQACQVDQATGVHDEIGCVEDLAFGESTSIRVGSRSTLLAAQMTLVEAVDVLSSRMPPMAHGRHRIRRPESPRTTH